MQFIRRVERAADRTALAWSLNLAAPAYRPRADEATHVTEWSVRPADYGNFLVTIFDKRVHQDVGSEFVQIFDVSLGIWAGAGSSLCVFSEKCGSAGALEHNGDLYSCDHFVYPRFKLGNILNSTL